MPFKDTVTTDGVFNDAIYGWSPERCKLLGADIISAIYRLVNDL